MTRKDLEKLGFTVKENGKIDFNLNNSPAFR